METIISITTGAVVTWLVAWWYYKRAGDELRLEAKSLRAATDAILYLQQYPDAKVEVQRTKDGRVQGLLLSAQGRASVHVTVRGNLTDAGGA